MKNFIFDKPSDPSFSKDGADGYKLLPVGDKLEIDFIDSKTGHGGKAVSDLITHYYYILEGSGEFIIDNNPYVVSTNQLVKIEPNHTFDYKGKMKMLLIMDPPFDPSHIKEL